MSCDCCVASGHSIPWMNYMRGFVANPKHLPLPLASPRDSLLTDPGKHLFCFSAPNMRWSTCLHYSLPVNRRAPPSLKRLSLGEPDILSPESSGQTIARAPVAQVVGALVRIDIARVVGDLRLRSEPPLDLLTRDDPTAR